MGRGAVALGLQSLKAGASGLGGGVKSGRSCPREAAVTGGETMGLSICSSLGEGTLQ